MNANQKIAARLIWDEHAREACRSWGIAEEDAKKVILTDTRPTLDPHSNKAGHPIVRFRSGDVIVVVGLRDILKPKVLFVTMAIPGMAEHVQRTSRGGAGTSLPTSGRQLRQWIIGFGYRIKSSSHDKIFDPETDVVIMSLANTPSDNRTNANEWRRFLKAHARYQAKKKLNKPQ